MKYIECTHCGKRYGVTDKISDSEGRFVRCKECLEKFMIVIHDTESLSADGNGNLEGDVTGGWNPALTVPPDEASHLNASAARESSSSESEEMDWDPTQTMPDVYAAQDDSEAESLTDEEAQAKAEETLAAIQQAKKKQQMIYGAVGAVLLLLIIALYMMFFDDVADDSVAQSTVVAKRLTAEEVDKQSPECRTAAARQWLLDYKAMHEKYDAKTFMMILRQTESRTDDVKAACKNPLLLQAIIDAATLGERPEWFASEIQAISRK